MYIPRLLTKLVLYLVGFLFLDGVHVFRLRLHQNCCLPMHCVRSA